MDKDTVIRLAREADLWLNEAALDAAVRFAALVVEREREECAKVCEEKADLAEGSPPARSTTWKEASRYCAAAIRSKNQS